MLETVIKKDGARESFDSDKLRKAVLEAAREAGLSISESQSVASRVISTLLSYTSNQEEIYTYELRNLILGDLDQFAPEVSKAWREHDKKVKSS